MTNEIRSKIQGAFHGYSGGAIFRLTNGQVWQQRRYRYRYKYKYRPDVRIFKDGSRYYIEVAGMNEPIEVVRIQVVCEGRISSDFSGFDGDSVFEFDNGQIWKQAAYKYSYHYAYYPEAIVVDGLNGLELHVEDMDDPVQVTRIR